MFGHKAVKFIDSSELRSMAWKWARIRCAYVLTRSRWRMRAYIVHNGVNKLVKHCVRKWQTHILKHWQPRSGSQPRNFRHSLSCFAHESEFRSLMLRVCWFSVVFFHFFSCSCSFPEANINMGILMWRTVNMSIHSGHFSCGYDVWHRSRIVRLSRWPTCGDWTSSCCNSCCHNTPNRKMVKTTERKRQRRHRLDLPKKNECELTQKIYISRLNVNHLQAD